MMSGTSADGVDAVVCRIAGRGLRMRAKVLHHHHVAYEPAWRTAVLEAASGRAMSGREFCRLHWRLGEVFAAVAQAALQRAGLAPARLSLIGCHGQTICHDPPTPPSGRAARGPRVGGTWQIGEPAVIAARLGVPVVSNFRAADMAAGGQGAPLVPWTDHVLFGGAGRPRAVQNIGGIANVTWLPRGGAAGDVRAFDTGPGNMIIDGVVHWVTEGRLPYDRGGALAARGRVMEDLADAWLSDPYFLRPPPKSCGREQFGRRFWMPLARRRRRSCRPEDLVATATHLTARTIADAYRRFLHAGPRAVRGELIVCGGGARNRTLLRMLAAELPAMRVRVIDSLGIPNQAKEGLSFAMLACACVDRVPANLPAATGASRPVICGQVIDPPPR